MRYFVLLVLSCGMFAYAGKYHPIYNAEFTYEKATTDKDVARAIKKSLIGRGWTVKTAEPGMITAKILIRAHTADIEITYGHGQVNIVYKNSTNLGYRKKKGVRMIHRNYNNWIINLERDISASLI